MSIQKYPSDKNLILDRNKIPVEQVWDETIDNGDGTLGNFVVKTPSTGPGGTGTTTVTSVDIGEKADASASTDTGTASLIALTKRGLEKGTSIDGKLTAIGNTNDSMASSDTGTFSLIALVKRILDKLSTSNTNVSSIVNGVGYNTDITAASDTGTYGLTSLIKRLLTKTPSLGSATSANSSPVVIASDQSSISILKRNGVTTSSGTISSAYVSGTAQVVIALQDGQNTYCASISPTTFTGTLLWVYSYDNINWLPLVTQRPDSFGNAPSSTLALSGSSATAIVRGNIPPGATHIGINCSPYTSGSVVASLYASASDTANIVTAMTQGIASTARIGFTASSGIGYNDSTSALLANAVFVSAAKTGYNTSSATSWNVASSYGDKFRVAAGSDVPGRIIVEFSVLGTAGSAVTDWYPLGSLDLIQIDGANNYGGYLEFPIVGTYMRARFINGPLAQTRFYMTTNLKA